MMLDDASIVGLEQRCVSSTGMGADCLDDNLFYVGTRDADDVPGIVCSAQGRPDRRLCRSVPRVAQRSAPVTKMQQDQTDAGVTGVPSPRGTVAQSPLAWPPVAGHKRIPRKVLTRP